MLVFAPTTNLGACDVSCIREAAVPGRARAQDGLGTLISLGALISLGSLLSVSLVFPCSLISLGLLISLDSLISLGLLTSLGSLIFGSLISLDLLIYLDSLILLGSFISLGSLISLSSTWLSLYLSHTFPIVILLKTDHNTQTRITSVIIYFFPTLCRSIFPWRNLLVQIVKLRKLLELFLLTTEVQSGCVV